MVSILRAQRIGERIQEELSEILIYEVSDPRLDGVSVTDVTVDRELAFASIYVSALEGSERADEILEGFNSAKGFLRRELASRIDLRVFPDLRFNWDPTYENAERIDQLICCPDNGGISGSGYYSIWKLSFTLLLRGPFNTVAWTEFSPSPAL